MTWKHVVHFDFTDITHTGTSINQYAITGEDWQEIDARGVIYVRVRDKSGPRNGCFYRSDAIFQTVESTSSRLLAASLTSVTYDETGNAEYTRSASATKPSVNGNSVFARDFTYDGDIVTVVTLGVRGTIDASFDIDVFTADLPS